MFDRSGRYNEALIQTFNKACSHVTLPGHQYHRLLLYLVSYLTSRVPAEVSHDKSPHAIVEIDFLICHSCFEAIVFGELPHLRHSTESQRATETGVAKGLQPYGFV